MNHQRRPRNLVRLACNSIFWFTSSHIEFTTVAYRIESVRTYRIGAFTLSSFQRLVSHQTQTTRMQPADRYLCRRQTEDPQDQALLEGSLLLLPFRKTTTESTHKKLFSEINRLPTTG